GVREIGSPDLCTSLRAFPRGGERVGDRFAQPSGKLGNAIRVGGILGEVCLLPGILQMIVQLPPITALLPFRVTPLRRPQGIAGRVLTFPAVPTNLRERPSPAGKTGVLENRDEVLPLQVG